MGYVELVRHFRSLQTFGQKRVLFFCLFFCLFLFVCLFCFFVLCCFVLFFFFFFAFSVILCTQNVFKVRHGETKWQQNQ